MGHPAVWISLLVMFNLLWAGSYAVMKFGTGSMDPLAIIYLRVVFAFLILAVWSWYKKYSFKIGFRDTMRIVIAGILTGASHFLVISGVNISQATDASLLYVFEPLWGIILAGLFLREKLRASTVIALFIILVGLARLSDFDLKAFGWSDGGVGFGNVLIVIGLFAESLFSIILKPVAKRHSAAMVMTLVLFVASVVLTPLMIGRYESLFVINLSDVLVIAYLTILCTVVGYTGWVRIMKHVPVSVMIFSIFIQPIFGPLIAAATLGENIDARILTGGVFLISGMFVAVVGYLRAHRREINVPAAGKLSIVGNI